MLLAKDFTATANGLMKAAYEVGFEACPSAPLTSAFWGTTFAPSSTEVLFRELAARGDVFSAPARLCTLQPCARVNDIAPWSDGFHLPYFTLFTCFVIGCADPLPEVQRFLDSLKRIGIPVRKSCFTYFDGTPPLGAPTRISDFDETFLERLDIDKELRVPCAGMANYELAKRHNALGREYLIYGPKIEVFDSAATNIEYGTLIYSRVKMSGDTESSVPILQMGVGVERSTLVQRGLKSVWEIQALGDLKSTVILHFIANACHSPLLKDVEHALELVLTLLLIAREAPDVTPGSNSVRAQLRRIIRAASHKITHIGIPARELLALVHGHSVGKIFSAEQVELAGRWLSKEPAVDT